MYVVYIIYYNTYEVKVKKIVKTEQDAINLMQKLAIDFMAHEEGKRKARIITETPFDTSDIIKGYILFSPESSKIDVYYKDIIIATSLLWGEQQETKLNKIKGYSYTKVLEEDSDEEDLNDI